MVASTEIEIHEIKLDRLDLSTRTANCCQREGITTLGALAALRWTDIAKWRNAGRKTLVEIREVLGSVGLHLRGDPTCAGEINLNLLRELQLPPPEPSHDPVFLLENATQDQLKSLVIPIDKLPLSVRARNIVVRVGAKRLGDLAQQSKADILSISNSGKGTLTELQMLLESHGLQLGMRISDWSDEQVAAITKRLSGAIAAAAMERSNRLLAKIDPSPRSLEAELGRIVRAFESERNADALLKLWGWSGNDPRVLESVGQEFNLTRERVRQIEVRAIQRFSTHKFDLPFVRRAIETVVGCIPMVDDDISKRLKVSGVATTTFSVWGLKKAAEIFNIRWSFGILSVKGMHILTARGDEHKLRRGLIELRKRTSDRGLTNIAALCAEIDLGEAQASGLRRFLEIAAEIAWLDEIKDWLFLPDVPRNRLVNLCSKVFSVSPAIRIAELRRAVSKSRRLAMVPPQRILAAFVERQRLATVTNNVARVIPGAVGSLAENSVEANMLKVLDEHGPIMDGEQFARRCVEAGINATSFYLYRLNSPVISSLGKGVYCKVGTDVPPGAFEDILARRNATPRVSDHGWTTKGRLWFGMELNVGAIAQGSVRLESFVSDFVQGEWQVVLPDQSMCGTVNCKGVFIHSFRRAFGLLGAEHSDFATFEFDLNARHVHVSVGGPGLFEQIEDPESMQAEGANDDVDEV